MHYEIYSLLKESVRSYSYYLLARNNSNINLIYSQYKNLDLQRKIQIQFNHNLPHQTLSSCMFSRPSLMTGTKTTGKPTNSRECFRFPQGSKNSAEISYLPMHRIRQRLISFGLGIVHLTSFSQNKHFRLLFKLMGILHYSSYYMCFLTLLKKSALTRQIQT